MSDPKDFDLQDFLPYLLNQAAEASSAGFRATYKNRYGMLRSEWRVLFHLGTYGDQSARDICNRASMHKTEISRAVAALETRRMVSRQRLESDRRFEIISLTQHGIKAFEDLRAEAQAYNESLQKQLTKSEQNVLAKALRKLAN